MEPSPTAAPAPDEVASFRQRLLRNLYLGFVIVCVPALAANIWASLSFGWSLDALFYGVSFAVLLVGASTQRRLGYRSGALLALAVLWAVGLASLARFSLIGAGLLCYSALCFLATALFGLRGGLKAMAICGLTLVTMGILFAAGLLESAPVLVESIDSPTAWLAMGTSFFLFAFLGVYSSGVVLAHAEKSLRLLGERTAELERVNTALTREIGDRKRAVEEKEALEVQLRHVQKMEAMGRLAGGIAHDFNNLLLAIRGNTELALLRLPAESPVSRYLDAIDRSTERGSALTRQLLTFSRRQVAERRVVSLNALLLDMRDMIRGFLGERVELDLWTGSESDRVLADRSAVQQLLLNLASNAKDAMPNGGRLALATADARVDEADPRWILRGRLGPQVQLSISDTGCGMDPETLSHAFEPFYSTKPKDKGTGLGLSIVYGIVRQHEGSIQVATAPGQGTRITLYLPTVPAGRAVFTDEVTSDMALLGKETVLLVEDDALGRAAVVGMLESLGYQVLQAAHADDALQEVRQARQPIHLLLTDVVLPGLNGRELATEVQKLSPTTRVLFMSGYTEDEMLKSGVAAQEVRFLSKPFNRARLSQWIRRVLGDQDPSEGDTA